MGKTDLPKRESRRQLTSFIPLQCPTPNIPTLKNGGARWLQRWKATLQHGSNRQQLAIKAIEASRVLTHFAPEQLCFVAAHALGREAQSSDLDFIVAVESLPSFQQRVQFLYRQLPGYDFFIRKNGDKAACQLQAGGLEFELFASHAPVCDQPGWRHWQVIHALLEQGPPALREAFVTLKGSGMEDGTCLGPNSWNPRRSLSGVVGARKPHPGKDSGVAEQYRLC